MQMDTISQIYKQTGALHHAYLLVGRHESVMDSLTDFLEKDLLFITNGNPDFIQSIHDACGIDEARALKSAILMKPIGERKIAVLSFNSVTTEAQNSLLKIFEEPTGQTTFFVISPTIEIFLPTLLSRFFVVRENNRSVKNSGDSAKTFLASSPNDRISLVTDLVEKKDKTEAIQFLNSLEKIFAARLVAGEMDKETVSICGEIIKCRGFLYDRSPSVKMILHHLSCIMPVLAD